MEEFKNIETTAEDREANEILKKMEEFNIINQ